MSPKYFLTVFLFILFFYADVFAETIVTTTTTTTTTVTKQSDETSDVYIKNSSFSKTKSDVSNDDIYYYRKPRQEPNTNIENALIFGSGVAVGGLLWEYHDDERHHHKSRKYRRPHHNHFRY